MTQLHFTFLGTPQVQYGDQPLTFATRKALALLAYLAVEGGTHSREKLMGLFWPDSDEKRGRGALRITISYLRRALTTAVSPDIYLHITPHTLAFNFNAPHTLDIHSLDLQERSDLLSTLAFLDGFTLPDAPAFDEWLTVQRAHLHQQISQQFDRLSQQQADTHQFNEGLTTTIAWLAHDPLNETAHRRLMQLHSWLDNKTAALQAYAHCQTTLQAELGIEPAAETTALYQKIYDLRMVIDDEPHPDRQSSRTNRPSSLPFVGRASEHAQLTAVFHQLSQQTQSAVILGEPGIGKTRLAHEFLNWAVLHGADVLRGRAFEAGGRLPFQPLVAALRPRLEVENAPEDLLSDVWLAELSRLLPELRDRYPDLVVATNDDNLARTRLLEALAQLGTALTAPSGRSRPLILFIDDLQWADAATLDALHYCANQWVENRSPILLLFAIRSDHLAADTSLADWLAAISRTLSPTRLPLAAITAVATAQLVAEWQKNRAGDEQTATLSDWLFQETGGLPFYLSETLKLLQEETGASIPALSPTVRQLILTRLNRLSTAAMALLTAVAVIGRPTDFELICQLTATLEEDTLPALDELRQRQLLLETAATLHPYTFSHDKIRDIVYTEAGDARRRLYHRRALAALEQAHAPAAELAHHAFAAHLDEAAFRHSLSAGDEAMSLFALTDAVHHYLQAKSLHLPISPSLFTNLSRAYELMGEFDNAKSTAEEMLALAQQAHDVDSICAAHNRLATLAIYTHQLETAAYHLEQIRHTAVSSQHNHPLAEAEWGLAQLAQHRYDMQTAKTHSQHALQLAQALEKPELIARSHNSLGYAHLLLGELEAAVTTMGEARQRYHQLGDRALEADSLTGMAGAMIFQGRATAAIPVLEEALAIYEAIENPWGILFSSGWLAAGLLDVGRLEDALALCEQSAVHAAPLGSTPVTIWHDLWTGNARRALGQLDLAIVAHQQAARLNAPHPLRPFAEYIAAELCADYVLLGDWSLAGEQAKAALQHRNYQALPQIVLPRWAGTAALLRAGQGQKAREDIQQSHPLWGQLRQRPRFAVPLLRAQAILAQKEGNLTQAITHLQSASTLATNLNLPNEMWQILATLSQLYPHESQRRVAREQGFEIIHGLTGHVDEEGWWQDFVTAVSNSLE